MTDCYCTPLNVINNLSLLLKLNLLSICNPVRTPVIMLEVKKNILIKYKSNISIKHWTINSVLTRPDQ